MRLVIRQYLESLKERGELDVLLPDLLSQMGLEVFLTPGIGARQFGVDVAAVGSIDNSEARVFLFSIKAGNLGRRDWDSGNPQDLRASINEIIDIFITQRIPPEHQSKKVSICLCFGGEIKEEVRPNVTAFTQKATKDNLTFEEWNGDKLSELIERYFLQEELLPKQSRALLRKALAMLDEPSVSFQHFTALISLLSEEGQKAKKTLIVLRQIYICTAMLFTWCRDSDNLESAYLSAEFSLLKAWDICKPSLGKKGKAHKTILKSFYGFFDLYISITTFFLGQKIIPHTLKLHALSHAVRSSNSVDINLKLFDILGRISLAGIWMYWIASRFSDEEEQQRFVFLEVVHGYREAVKNLIINNPVLYSPCKDDQAIDIALAVLLLSIEHKNDHNIRALLRQWSESIYQQFNFNNNYPSNIHSYSELIEHPVNNTNEYRESVTKGSILYPLISIFSAIYEEHEAYEIMQKLKEDYLKHCNYQIYFFDDESEKYLYDFEEMHGATLSHININQEPMKLLDEVYEECKLSNNIKDLSAVKYSYWPLLLVASRHYRIPVPIHFIMEPYSQTKAN